MENIITLMNRSIININSDDSLAGILKRKFKEIPISQSSPPEYFYLTSLCDPYKEYILNQFPDFKEDEETQKKFIIGRKLHSFAEKWFKGMKDFVSSESTLDGFYVGIKARGRVDAKIGNSIIELKTKQNLPENSEEVIQKFSQDIEQLAFYSVLDPIRPKTNFLVFMTQSSPYKFKVFKIEIKNHDKIKEILQKRINTLRGVILGGINPKVLGKCRYCPEACKLKEEGKCNPEILKSKECEITEYISIQEDTDFKEELENSISLLYEDLDFYKLFDIIAPRKYFNKNIKELTEELFETNTEDKINQEYLNHIIFNTQEFKLEREDFNNLPNSIIDRVHFPKRGWLKIRDLQNPEGKILPFIAFATPSTYERGLERPSEYKIAELGIATLLHGKTKGLIIVYYPKLNKEVKVFEVDFSFYPNCRQQIETIIRILKDKREDKFGAFPFCPDFMHNDCSFKGECEKIKRGQ